MKILELRAENIKNLKAIEIRPGDDAVILSGKNGAGKSAILDSIFISLTGKKIEQPIRNGENRAEINVDLGDYKIRRIFTEKSDRLEVLSKEGAAFKSPQTLLNAIFGDLSFDPLAFSNMKEKPQRELLAQLVGLDFTEIDAKRVALYNERTVKNREIKGSDSGQYRDDPNAPLPLESLVSKMEVPKPGTPRLEISIAEEIAKIEVIEDKRDNYLDALKAKETLEAEIKQTGEGIEKEEKEYNQKINELIDEVARINEEIARLRRAKKDNAEGGIAAINKTYEKIQTMAIPEEVKQEDIAKARQALSDIEATNIKIRKAIEYDKKQAELKEAKRVIKNLEDGMMKIEIEKDRRLKEAKFPIESLSLTDTCVIYNNKPFSQLSTGEQIRISTAIAMTLNPQLKIILIREGSLLDSEGLKAVTEIAKGRDYQLWIEKVSDDKGVGIYIEDGEIKS